ncbi:MAG: type II secretion system F family protein [Acidithiobacillus sp.]|nr:type II secretion system F family protein [Acidithiobacillus sp.]
MATTVANKQRKEVKTTEFRWEAKSPDGRTRQKGEMLAPSANVVKAQLRRAGLQPIVVAKVRQPLFGGEGIKEANLVVMVRQLSTMINAGVPMVQSFELLISASSQPAMRKLLSKILRNLNEGESLSQALAHYPKYFDRLFISLVAAGEQGGILDTILLRLADYREKSLALNKKVKSAMFYPAAIISVMVVVVVILMIFVIPVFAKLFSSFGATLPLLTQVVINISDWMRGHWYMVVLIPIVLVFAFRYAYRRSDEFKVVVDRYALKIPVIGDILLKGAVARFNRTLSTMQAAGVPILEALDTLSRVSGNAIIEKSILRSRADVAAGGRISTKLKEDGVFPLMATQMLAIGEETGAIEVMSGKVADFYENEVNEAVSRLTTLMEPMIMVVLGIIVGTLVVAMYLPIFKMGAVVTHGG